MRASLVGAQGLYRRGRHLVRVSREEGELPKGVERPPDAPAIRMVTEPLLADALSRCGDYLRVTRTLKDGTRLYEPCYPPRFGVEALMAGERFPVPMLEGIVEAPVLLKSGKILDTPGYDAYSGLFYEPPRHAKFLPVPAHPTAREIKSALNWFHEAVTDFPFDQPEHRSAWMAGVLSYFARWAYSGPTPLFLVDGNVRGAGKGKLAGAAAQICLGRKPMIVQQTADEKSERELITSVALSGEMMVFIDNINYPFGSSPLDSALTEAVWVPILKYKNEPSRFTLNAVWWGNGNNIIFRAQNDTVRRSVKIQIVSPLENPEQRDDFQRPEPGYSRWLRENRPSFVWAALTLLRGFVQAGSPTSGMRLWGSFEGWSQVVRGTLVWAGEPDPYLAAAVHDQASDGGSEALSLLLRGWKALCHDQNAEGLTVHEALTALREHSEYAKAGTARHNPHEALLGAIRELAKQKTAGLPEPGHLGVILKRSRRRPLGGLRLINKPAGNHVMRWFEIGRASCRERVSSPV